MLVFIEIKWSILKMRSIIRGLRAKRMYVYVYEDAFTPVSLSLLDKFEMINALFCSLIYFNDSLRDPSNDSSFLWIIAAILNSCVRFWILKFQRQEYFWINSEQRFIIIDDSYLLYSSAKIFIGIFFILFMISLLGRRPFAI